VSTATDTAPALDYWAAAGQRRRADTGIDDRLRKFADRFPAGAHVVDLGCGDGRFLRLLEARGVRATGVDQSAAALDECVRAGLTAVRADAVAYLRQHGPFDGIFSAGLLEHLDRADVETLVARAAAQLSPGGLFLAVLPNPASLLAHLSLFHEDPTHVRFYPAGYVEALCRASGLEAIESREDEDTLGGWGGRFTADFAQLEPLARRDPAVGVLVRVVEDLATHFNTVLDQLVRPLEFYVAARKPRP
jgi:SAM-dependent methyltransferase